jgi:hypothetical protein
MPTQITLEKIKSMSADERLTLYRNALDKGTPEALAIINDMIQHNLLVTDQGGFPEDHPAIIGIREVVTSPEGRAAAKAAADKGLPALAGVDAMLSNALGHHYGPHETIRWAGFYVAGEMRKLGYKESGQRSLPAGSVAKTGAYFRPD